MTNLLYITNSINGSGGLERVLSIKTDSFACNAKTYMVNIVTLKGGHNNLFYNFNKSIEFYEIEIDESKSLTYLINYFKELNKIIADVKPSIILICDDGIKAFLAPFLIKSKAPLIYERHASINLIKRQNINSFKERIRFLVLKKFMLFNAKYFNKFVVLTNKNLKEWNLKNGLVIPNPLTFYPETVSNLSSKVVLTVANHGYQKGLDRLIKVWETVNNRVSGWELRIIGLKDKNGVYEKMTQELGLENTIKFFNPTKFILEEYLKASIYALPSRSEGFGMVLIEAMACGVPCVSFDCPSGPGDIIDNNENGFLIENGNIDDFADKLVELMTNQELRNRMGGNARITAKKYLPENIIKKWDTLFLSYNNHTE